MDDRYDQNNHNDDESNIVVMFDDEGNEQELYVFGSIEYNGEMYLIVSENLDVNEFDEEHEVIILKEIKIDSSYYDDKIDYQVVEDDDLIDIILSLFEDQDEDGE